MKHLPAFVCVLLACCCLTLAQERREAPEFRAYGQAATRADGDAIEELIRRYKQFWGEQDTDALMRLHAGDVEWINAYARMFRGTAPLSVFLRDRLFPVFSRTVSEQEAAQMKAVSIRYLAGHAAVVHMYTDGQRGPSRNAGEEARRTHIHLVLEKQGSTWKIVHTAIMDAR